MLRTLFEKPSVTFSETNTLFRMFQINAFVLLACSGIIAIKEHFGTPIDCIYDGIQEQHKKFVDNYCWKKYEPIVPEVSSIPTKSLSGIMNTDMQVFSTAAFQRTQLNYYRWIPFMLLLEAFISIIPSWLWSILRDRRLFETMASIKEPQRQPSRRKLHIINLANDLFTESIQRRYAKPFFFCEILNIVALGLNIIITNLMFHNRFLMFGISELGLRIGRSSFNNGPTYSEMFPTFATCSVQMVKKDDGIRKEDAICMISYNSLCEGVFFSLWIWFIILIVATTLGASYRIFMMLSRGKRKSLLVEAVDKSCQDKMSLICEKLGFYSWFTLFRISRNVDPLTFQDIISSLLAKIDSIPIYKTIKVNKPKPQPDADNQTSNGTAGSALITIV